MSQTGIHTAQTICCSQCGATARRLYFTSSYSTHLKCPGRLIHQVECPSCDYLLVSCAVDGRVVEAYGEGISIYQHSANHAPSPPEQAPLEVVQSR